VEIGPRQAAAVAPVSVDQSAGTDSAAGDEHWKARFRAARMTLPSWAADQPDHAIFASNASGTVELYAWERGTGVQRQLTRRPAGTMSGALDPTGTWVWWFDDDAGNEFGVWRRQPFASSVSAAGADAAVPGLAPSYRAGLALSRDGGAIIGRSTDDGSTIHQWQPGFAEPLTLYHHTEDASVAALSRDGTLLAIAHSEHGDSRHQAIRVLTLDPAGSPTTVGELWDGPGLGLEAVGFAPVAGDNRLLVLHERKGRWLPSIWDAATGATADLEIDLPGDVFAGWYVDGSAILVGHEHHARTELYRYDLGSRELSRLDTPLGTLAGATARPDGVVEFLWSSGAEPSVVRDTNGRVVLAPPGPRAPSSVPVSDAWVPGPAGDVHALISKPDVEGPAPTIFIVHGGPTSHDTDAFSPVVAAWVDAGFVVIRVNYRGSDGYGSVWRDAIEQQVGLTELEDVVAVRDWAVSSGLADPARIVLSGGSWGGYLTLLGLGTQPASWSVGVAGVPVADYVAAYEDEMENLRAFDRSLFGGTPDDVPERYRLSSPLTYVDALRAPVLVLAGENDPRCPIRQIENYLVKLTERGATFEVYRFDAGHGSLVVEERLRQFEAELDFVRRHLPA
jgi:dipeptidyl aminopeptidase/acylaminoacyl peptidase